MNGYLFMLRDGATEKFLDILEMRLEPPLEVRAARMREDWDDDEAFSGFSEASEGFVTS
ncbi:hypothetical protein [Ilumatobacter sp.]|uniref:hypothetical protein n=1 Tax=Ilumatobacter sp. TaxID=1967498 RepID=UPI00375021E2